MTWRAALMAAVVAFPAGEAVACKCFDPEDAIEARDDADLVFEGRAVDRHATQVLTLGGYYPAWSYELVVDRQWKGEVRPNQFVAIEFTSCGFGLARGERVMVYATRQPDGQYKTNRCKMPRVRDVARLGKPIYEPKPVSLPPEMVARGWPTDFPDIWSEWDPELHRPHAHTARDAAFVLAGVGLALFPPLWRRFRRRRAS